MPAWSDDLWQSVVLLTEQDPTTFGTGFVVCADARGAWVVTCAHVLDQLTPAAAIRANDHPAQPVAEPHPEFDLAVLHVPELPDVQPLALSTTTVPGSTTWIPGWHSVLKHTKRRYPLSATLGPKRDFSARGATIQRTFELQIKGFADADASQADRREQVIHTGYSGASVFCPDRRAVVAVASIETGQGEAAFAVAIEHLAAIWPHEAPPLRWQSAPPSREVPQRS